MSRPPRARGLKQVHVGRLVKREHVAPPAGAWIETLCDYLGLPTRKCRAPRGRVD